MKKSELIKKINSVGNNEELLKLLKEKIQFFDEELFGLLNKKIGKIDEPVMLITEVRKKTQE